MNIPENRWRSLGAMCYFHGKSLFDSLIFIHPGNAATGDQRAKGAEQGRVQVWLHDFDGDGVEEVVVAYMPHVVDGEMYVLKYFPPSVKGHFDKR